MRLNYVRLIVCATTWILVMAIQSPVRAQDPIPSSENLMDMNLEDLLNLKVTVASKQEESQTEAPGVVVVVPREEFQVYGDRNLHQLLQRQPSVYTRGSYLYPHNLASFRGDMPSQLDVHTLVLFNGRPIRSSTFGGDNYPVYLTFPMESLGSVELVRGPGSALYGTNAFTGVINLKSRPIPNQTEGSVSALGGSYSTYATTASIGGRSGSLGYVADARFTGQQGFPYSMTDDVGVYNSHDDDNKSFSGTTHLEYRGLTFDVFALSLESFYMGTLPRWSSSDHNIHNKTIFSNLGYRLPLHKTVDAEFNLTYNLHKTRFWRMGIGNTDWDCQDWLGEVTLYAHPTDRLNFAFGYLQEYQQKLNSRLSNSTLDPPYTVHPQSAYGQGDYKVTDWLKLIAGAQWNESGYDKQGTVTRYGVILNPLPKWGIKLLRGEAFRAPFALEALLNDPPILVGNRDLAPERIVTTDAQLFYNDDKTSAAITYFHSKINDVIIRKVNPAPTPSTFTNAGEWQFDGIEFEAKRFLTPHWHILGSTLYQDSIKTANLNLSTVPHYMLKLGSGYSWDWGTAAVFYSHFSKPPRLPTEVVVNPEPGPLNMVSLNVRIDPSKWVGTKKDQVVLTFKVENAIDEAIWVPDFNRRGNPNSLPEGTGTTAYAGVIVNF